ICHFVLLFPVVMASGVLGWLLLPSRLCPTDPTQCYGTLLWLGAPLGFLLLFLLTVRCHFLHRAAALMGHVDACCVCDGSWMSCDRRSRRSRADGRSAARVLIR